MNPILRNVLAVIAGIMLELILNGTLISLGGTILPVPEGVDPNDLESIKTNIHLYSIQHFIAPFLAHALGTLAGTYLTCKLAVSGHLNLAMIVATAHFLGGLAMASAFDFQPLYFSILDLCLAYFPMGILGWKLAHPLNALSRDDLKSSIIDGSLK
ncbi:MAG: hypothetical protein AB8B53_02495 [Flavobacteriales bacterium]